MSFAAASTAARSAFRSSAARSAAVRVGSQARSSPFRLPSRTPLVAPRIFRSPVELSACLDSFQPFHTATSSALMTSMLNASSCGFAWLPDACNDDF